MLVEWSKGAERNLDSIEAYIAQDNPAAAAKTVLKIVRITSPNIPPAVNQDESAEQEN